ncbi:MAG: zinc-finger domain-containing protein [Caldimonas sp.]
MADDASRGAVELSAAELEGPGVVFCPNPRMPLWSHHPRVYIDVATRGVGKCPYCGTEYRLKPGEKVAQH